VTTPLATGISHEFRPASNVSLGVYHSPEDVPLRTLMRHGAQIALSADDPLLFQSRLINQYEIARALGCDDAELAELARGSINASLASPTAKRNWVAEVDDWLAAPDQRAETGTRSSRETDTPEPHALPRPVV